MDYDEWKEDFGYDEDPGMSTAAHNEIMEAFKIDTAEMVRDVIHAFRGDLTLTPGDFKAMIKNLEKQLDTKF